MTRLLHTFIDTKLFNNILLRLSTFFVVVIFMIVVPATVIAAPVQGASNSPAPVQGASNPGATNQGQSSGNVTLVNPLGTGTTLNTLLDDILQFVVRIGSIVVILMLVYVGYMFVVAQGKPEEISKAKQALMWTVIGALVLLGAEAIAQGIQATVQALSAGG